MAELPTADKLEAKLKELNLINLNESSITFN